MRSKPTRPFATRLPAQQADLVDAAIEETESTQSDFLRRALEYYVRRNPDDIQALYPDDSALGIIRDMERGYDE